MLDHFTFRISEAVDNIEWIKRHGMIESESYWYNNLTQEIYFYLDLLQSEPDIECYDY